LTGWHALVLAGARGPDDAVARAAGVAHKAFAPVAGQPMIAHVLDALGAVPEVSTIAVSIAPDAPALPEGVTRLDAGPGPAASTLAAFDRLGPPLLVATADHPLLTPAMVAEVLDAARGTDAVAAVSPRAAVERTRPGARRTYIRLADGAVSGANLFALATPRARGAVELWQRLEADRKRPWRMARRIGARALLAYLAGRLDSTGAACALGRAAGCSAALAILDHDDAAHDVDRPEDIAFAEARLAARRQDGSMPDSKDVVPRTR